MVFDAGNMVDITPFKLTTNAAPNFTTTIGSNSVKVTLAGSNMSIGDWAILYVTVSVGGLILQGFYPAVTVIDANNFTITASRTATANINNGGAVPAFTTINGQANVSVLLNDHGYSPGALFPVQVQTTVGGITILAQSFTVLSVTDANNFVIAPGGTATSGATGSENGGNELYEFLIPNGFASNTALSGYGIGDYGAGDYGLANSASITAPLRQWFLDNWGQDLIGNYTNGPIYFWVPPAAANTPATIISGTQAPLLVNSSFVAMPQQIMMALGCDPFPQGSTRDPNLIRWSDVADFTTWNATAINQAGSFRLPTGSRIVGGVQGPQFGGIWTDIDFWQIQYLGAPLVFGFLKIGGGVELLAARGAGIYQSVVYWVSLDNFLMFDGNSVQIIECTVWDKFFANINTAQIDKVFCAVNSVFNEVAWFYPSATGNGEIDSYVKYQTVDRVWDYGSLIRTAWIDENPLGTPIGADTSGLLQQHEIGNTADGVTLNSFLQSGAFIYGEGDQFIVIERGAPDFVTRGGNRSVSVTLSAQNYPNGPIVSTPKQLSSPVTQYLMMHLRGRAQFLGITGDQFNVFWRLGAFRYIMKPGGKR